MYKLTVEGVLNIERRMYITENPDNPYWQEYLEWVNQGNTPEPIFTLEEFRAITRNQINEWRYQALKDSNKTVEVDINGTMVPFQVDPLSMEELNNALTLFNSANPVPIPENFTWRDANNVNQPANVNLLITIAANRSIQVNAIWSYSWTLKEACENATTIEELEAITWNLIL